jgi:predicted permease
MLSVGADAFKITMFPLGGYLLISKDFEGPDVDSEEVRERMHLRRRRLAAKAMRLSRLFRHSDRVCDTEARNLNDIQEKDTISHNESVRSESIISQKALTSTRPPTTSHGDIETHEHVADHRRPSCRLYSRLRHFSTELLKPIPIVIAISVLTALVDPLKALFLAPSGSFQPRFRPVAPDGQPPLAFVLDTADFIGAASVPIGLICLGSALARLRVRSGEMFPHGAITVLALSRMVVTPLLGVGITRWFVHAGFVARDDKVLQFVCMCVFRPSIDALLFIYAFADERFCVQPFLRSAVGYHSGERAFFSAFVSFRHVLIGFRRCTSHKSTRPLALWNTFRRS